MRRETPEQKARHRETSRLWKIANASRVREGQRQWRAANPEKTKVSEQRKAAKYAKEIALRSRVWYSNNKERAKENSRRWRRSNPERTRVHNQKHALRYIARRKSSVHPELDQNAERLIVEECQQAIRSTGQLHQVDHIIPLAAGGYHHHLNLQVLPALMNKSKRSDPFWEEPGFKCWRDVPQYLWPARLAPAYHALLTSSPDARIRKLSTGDDLTSP